MKLPFRILKQLTLLVFMGSIVSHSQEILHCGTASLMDADGNDTYYSRINAEIKKFMFQKTDRSTLVIPVVFHIVYNTPSENIPDSLIFQQMDRLNQDFKRLNADTVNTPEAFQSIAGSMDIEFCLARTAPSGEITSGILRIATDESGFSTPASYDIPDPVKHSETEGSDAWNTQEYLNIWICNLSGSTAYTAPPGNFMDPADDGIVCDFNHIGNSGVIPYDMGRSIVHEVGHWFGLKHIWGDDAGSCAGTDYMADTPNQADWTGGCPDFPLNDACSPTGSGVMFMNYMDYSHDDCRNMFSKDQVTYMQTFYDALMSHYYNVDHCTIDDVGLKNQIEHARINHINNNIHLHSNDIISKVVCYQANGQIVQIIPIHSTNGTFQIPKTGFLIFEIYYVSNRDPEYLKFISN